MAPSGPALRLTDVDFVREGRHLLRNIDLVVEEGQHWALLGPNGAGKSTLLSLLGAREHPTQGTVSVLGQQLGRVDIRNVRRLIGHVEPRHSPAGPLNLLEVVLTGATGTSALIPYRSASAQEVERANGLISELGLGGRGEDPWGHLSQGERTRTLIARALMPEPRLLLLDEPATGLDLAAREDLLFRLQTLAAERPALTTVTVTHHLEELPSSTSHALLLRAGEALHSGPAGSVLTSELISACFGVQVSVTTAERRWAAAGVATGGSP